MFKTKYYGFLLEIKKLQFIVLSFYLVFSIYKIFLIFYNNGFGLDFNWFFVYMGLLYFCYLISFILISFKVLKNINNCSFFFWFIKKTNVFFIQFLFYNLILNITFFTIWSFFFIKYYDSMYISFFFFFIKSIARIDYTSMYVLNTNNFLFIYLDKFLYINAYWVIFFLVLTVLFINFFIFLYFFKKNKINSSSVDIDLIAHCYGIFLIYFISCTTIYYNFSILIYLYLFDFLLYCIFKKRNKFVNIFRFHFNIILVALLQYILDWDFFLAYLFIFFYIIFFLYYVLDILKFECFL